MREVTAIDPMWLTEIAPHFYEYKPKSQQLRQEAEEEPAKKKVRLAF